jgi:hypothetical protein
MPFFKRDSCDRIYETASTLQGMSFLMDRSKQSQSKDQPDHVATPSDAPPAAIVSPDTFRAGRVPPGQSRTKKWPVLDASGPPRLDLS